MAGGLGVGDVELSEEDVEISDEDVELSDEDVEFSDEDERSDALVGDPYGDGRVILRHQRLGKVGIIIRWRKVFKCWYIPRFKLAFSTIRDKELPLPQGFPE
jgi:hypothetical protein